MFDVDSRYMFNSAAPSYFATGTVINTCEELQCYWVLDCVASYARMLKEMNADYLKIVTVKLNDNRGCLFQIEDEINGILVTQEIDVTNLKEDIRWWAIDEGEYTIVLLPSEY